MNILETINLLKFNDYFITDSLGQVSEDKSTAIYFKNKLFGGIERVGIDLLKIKKFNFTDLKIESNFITLSDGNVSIKIPTINTEIIKDCELKEEQLEILQNLTTEENKIFETDIKENEIKELLSFIGKINAETIEISKEGYRLKNYLNEEILISKKLNVENTFEITINKNFNKVPLVDLNFSIYDTGTLKVLKFETEDYSILIASS